MMAFLSRNRDAGLLFLRTALGTFFLWAHGWAKLTGGTDKWRELGGAMKHLGITFWPTFWGFLATMSETVGVVLLIIGLAFRPACIFLAATMAMAGAHMWHLAKTSSAALAGASQAWELGIVFLALIFIGPGKYSLDRE